MRRGMLRRPASVARRHRLRRNHGRQTDGKQYPPAREAEDRQYTCKQEEREDGGEKGGINMEEDKERNNFGQEDGFAGGFSAAHVTPPTSAGRGLHRFHQLTIDHHHIEVYIYAR